MNYATNASLFVAFTTLPSGKEEGFRDNELHGLIRNYKKQQKEHHQRQFGIPETSRFQDDFNTCLYEPTSYLLFGNYDLAVVGLIDDYSLLTRNFHPYSHHIEQPKGYDTSHFKYQIITGPTRYIDTEQTGSEPLPNNFLFYKAKKTFLNCPPAPGEKAISRPPFIGITRIKLNNGLLIGNGAKYLALVERMIVSVLDKRKRQLEESDQKDTFDFLLTESFGWHELTLLTFSNNFRVLSDVIIGLRELKISHLQKFDPDPDKKTYQKIIDDSLLSQAIHGKNVSYDPEEAHVFVETISTFGVDMDKALKVIDEGEDLDGLMNFEDSDTGDSLSFFVRWILKPGHLAQMLDKFELREGDQSAFFMAGAEDYVFPSDTTKVDFKGLISLWRFYKKLNEEVAPDLNIAKKNVRKINTIPHFRYTFEQLKNKKKELLEIGDIVDTPDRPEQHFFFNETLKELAFSKDELGDIRNQLYHCFISTNLREKVLNMFVNFNDGIQDPILYHYFIDLKPFLNRVKHYIQNDKQKDNSGSTKAHSVREVHGVLEKFVQRFQLAFNNRFWQSHRMDGVTDFNMEFNGGCQQILTALDGAYKTITKVLGEKNEKISFVIISGIGVESSLYDVRLNYFHLFQPSIFVAPLIKEAANQIFEKSVPKFKRLNFPTEVLLDLAGIEADAGNLWMLFDRLKKFRHSDKQEIKELNYFFDPRLLKNFGADAFSLIYGYNGDFELYAFWYWGYFLQMTEMYNVDGKIDEDAFARFLIRYIFSHKISGFGDEHPGVISQLLLDPELADLWDTYYSTFEVAIAELLLQGDMMDWVTRVASICLSGSVLSDIVTPVHEKEIREPTVGADILTISLRIQQLIQTKNPENWSLELSGVMERISNLLTSCHASYLSHEGVSFENLCNARFYFVQNEYQRIKASFKAGKIFPFDPETHEFYTPSLFLNSLCYAYLRLIKEELIPDTGRITLLRNSQQKVNDQNLAPTDKGKISRLSQSESKIARESKKLLFDSMGGLHSSDFETRRKYFRFRSVFIRSLWDFSLIEKKDLFM